MTRNGSKYAFGEMVLGCETSRDRRKYFSMFRLVGYLKLRWTKSIVFHARTVAEGFNISGNNMKPVGGLCLESLIRKANDSAYSKGMQKGFGLADKIESAPTLFVGWIFSRMHLKNVGNFHWSACIWVDRVKRFKRQSQPQLSLFRGQ